MTTRFGNLGALGRLTRWVVPLFAVGFLIPALAKGQAGDTTRMSVAVKDLPLSTANRQSYAGSYTANLPQGGQSSVLVFEENGTLKLRVSDSDESRRLLYQGDNVFLAENTPDFVLTFVMDGGRATGFTVRKADGKLIVAVRNH